ncbi:MAG: hypothetical protein WC547_01125 [Candidatus Omnitrophota bacterium]
MKRIVYPNLSAEQAKRGLNDTDVAQRLGITRESYGQKKKTGKFKMWEAISLCELFESKFEYLFETGKEA